MVGRLCWQPHNFKCGKKMHSFLYSSLPAKKNNLKRKYEYLDLAIHTILSLVVLHLFTDFGSRMVLTQVKIFNPGWPILLVLSLKHVFYIYVGIYLIASSMLYLSQVDKSGFPVFPLNTRLFLIVRACRND